MTLIGTITLEVECPEVGVEVEVEGPGTEGEGGSARARAWEMACLMKRPAAALSTTREPVDSHKIRHVSYRTIVV